MSPLNEVLQIWVLFKTWVPLIPKSPIIIVFQVRELLRICGPLLYTSPFTAWALLINVWGPLLHVSSRFTVFQISALFNVWGSLLHVSSRFTVLPILWAHKERRCMTLQVSCFWFQLTVYKSIIISLASSLWWLVSIRHRRPPAPPRSRRAPVIGWRLCTSPVHHEWWSQGVATNA